MNDGVDPGQQVRGGVVGIPLAFVAGACEAPNQVDDVMPAGGIPTTR